MLSFDCHSAIENYLSGRTSILPFTGNLVNIHFITTYLPHESDNPHAGLKTAVRYRLANRNTCIILLSFLPMYEIRKHDTFGILNLTSAYFLQLPFENEVFVETLVQCTTPLIIPDQEWKQFSTNACKTLLKEELGKIRHGGQLDIGNKIIYPLLASCFAYKHDPSIYGPLIEQQLLNLQQFVNRQDLKNLFVLTDKANDLPDVDLVKISTFLSTLKNLADKSEINHAAVEQLIIKINNFSLIYNELISQ